jgi:recombination protein RecT
MTETQKITTAVATVDKTPGGMVRRHAVDFGAVLPTHVRADTWVRLAQGALKKGKKVKAPGGQVCTELELAALNNVGVFMASLMEAARLGLEPGTEQYYLTPRKVKGQLEILGIVGYQGYIELMYRAGAISSVVAEPVYTDDEFVWTPGALDTEEPRRWEGPQRVPYHRIDWDREDRGRLRLVYAYALMRDGVTNSKVVVLNRAAINKIKESSQGANSEYSPWVKHEVSMWLKSAVRQLAKWVPTSAEYRQAMQAQAVREVAPPPAGFAPAVEGDAAPVDITDQWVDDGVLDAEVVDE